MCSPIEARLCFKKNWISPTDCGKVLDSFGVIPEELGQ